MSTIQVGKIFTDGSDVTVYRDPNDNTINVEVGFTQWLTKDETIKLIALLAEAISQ
jgi:hypothetical protein